MIQTLRSYSIQFLVSFIVAAAIFLPSISFAQIEFSVVCPQKKIGKNDQLQIQFKVDNASNVDNITPPSFDNFIIVSGPNQQRSVSSINGKVSQSVSIGYSLQPTAIGRFTIDGATAIANGQHFQTKPFTIEVVPGSIAPSNNNSQNISPFANFGFDFPPTPSTQQFDDYILKPGENVDEKTAKNIFLRLDVDKTNCYVGSPIVATYKLYTRLPSKTTITDAPSFNGFSVNDFDVSNNSTLEKFNGRMYNVYTLRKVQLYPLQPGHITLDPIVADNKVSFIKSDYANSLRSDPFFDMLGESAIPAEAQVQKDVTLKSAPVTINVKPLPAEKKPANFRGAVGNFMISATLDKNNITTDDAGTLKLLVKGKGNIQMINAPAILWPRGIDGYDAKVKDDIDKTSVPMQGSKTFSYPFTVSKAGKYLIDSIGFSFFDPETSTYKTLYTAPLEIFVKKGKGIPNNQYVNNNRSAQKNPFITSRTEWIGGIALLGLIIAVAIFFLIKKNKNTEDLKTDVRLDDLKNEAGEEFRIPQNPLSAAHEKMAEHNGVAFYQTLDSSLKNYLAGKFNVPITELSKKRINEELDKCNISLGTSLMLTSLLNDIEMNLYTPGSNIVELNNVFEKASEVVLLLDKQVCK